MLKSTSRTVAVLATIGILAVLISGAWLGALCLLDNDFDRVVSLGAFMFSLLSAFVIFGIAALVHSLHGLNDRPIR